MVPLASERAVPPLASRKILVVDDQPSILGILEVALGEAGADVWTASDGPHALQSIEAAVPDLILLDLVMPGMNGWEVIEALAASPRTAGVPVILQTSAEDFTTFDRAKKHGVAAFISKPFRLNEVIETCRRIVGGERPLQGKTPEDRETPTVQVRSPEGDLIAVGRLLDVAPSGAQVEMDTALSLGQRVALTYSEGGQSVTLAAEVRWITREGVRFHHGLAIRSG